MVDTSGAPSPRYSSALRRPGLALRGTGARRNTEALEVSESERETGIQIEPENLIHKREQRNIHTYVKIVFTCTKVYVMTQEGHIGAAVGHAHKSQVLVGVTVQATFIAKAFAH